VLSRTGYYGIMHLFVFDDVAPWSLEIHSPFSFAFLGGLGMERFLNPFCIDIQ